ncbi:MAG TPA: hypothetical protein DDY70_01315 [Clostridiales bacterium]|nr:hypothetical protein [Clostridiales bacterium]
MEDANLETNVRVRLLLAGLSEMEEHGEGDFSLRRVAKRAQVSCAAPYRHFRDKEELIDGIFAYLLEKWDLLCREIARAFSEDHARHLTELSLAYLRFWLSNPNYRSVLLSRASARRREAFDAPLCRTAEILAHAHGMSTDDTHRLTFAVLSTVYGALLLAPQDTEEIQNTVTAAKEQITFTLNALPAL